MKKHILIPSLALLLAAFLWGCQEQASSPVEPEGLGIIRLYNTGVHFDGSVYELVKTSLNWKDAKKEAKRLVAPGCQSAHLATITSQAEQDIVDGLMAGTDGNAWLGGRQGGKSLEENWHWVNGEKIPVPPNVYTNWAGGEPNDTPFGTYIPGSEQHLEALDATAAVAGAWNDAPRFEEKFIIVESEHCN